MIKPYHPRRDVLPYRPVTVDIETSPDDGVIAVGVCIDGIVHCFENWEGFWDFYCNFLKQNKYASKYRRLYAHNGAGFDWLSFIQWAKGSDRIQKLDYIHSESFGIGVNITVDNVILKLRDSYRLLPSSLASLSKTYKIAQGKIHLDVLPHILKVENPKLFWEYLRHDVIALQEILYLFWVQIYDLVGSIEELPMTLPALAMKLWRMTLKEPIYTTWNKQLKEFERRAYSGGRTECYEAGETDVRIYDANSEYPTVMLSGQYPLSYKGGWTKKYRGQPGLYEIRYNQGNRFYKPVLRDETTGEFQYEGSGVYTQPEIDALISKSGTFECIKGYVFVEMGNPFKEFISTWWGIRRKAQIEGNDALAYVCKIFMNSLYGKFGQREEGWTLKLLTSDEIEDLLASGVKVKDAGEYTLVLEPRHSEYTFVSMAAYITSYARLHLYNEMCLAMDHGYKLYATDTDSVHISGGELPTSSDLGGWKKEFQGQGIYLGKKLYALSNGVIKSKGIGKIGPDGTPISTMTYNAFKWLAYHPDWNLVIDFQSFPSNKEVLIKQVPVGQMVTRSRTVRVTAKGIVNSS